MVSRSRPPEVAYEVADAIDRGDLARLRDELGDLLFQVVFHARMAEEAGHFDFTAVARAIHDKLVRRHPHIFQRPAAIDAGNMESGPVDLAQLHVSWEAQKAQARAAAVRPAIPPPITNRDATATE